MEFTKDICKKIAEMGMDQKDNRNDYWMGVDNWQRTEKGWSEVSWPEMFWEHQLKHEHYKIPNFEDLYEFAWEMAQRTYKTMNWHLSIQKHKDGYYLAAIVEEMGFRLQRVTVGEEGHNNTSTKEGALYLLICKLDEEITDKENPLK